jgi:hypothetical protein
MASRHLSIRLPDDQFERLEAHSRRTGQSRSEVAKTLLEEGLRMEQHPGIVFRSGPAGRRAGLAGGPDVWEVARVFATLRAEGDDAIKQAIEHTGLSRQQVMTALRYYADYRDEIQNWLHRVDEEATAAESAWRREQELLRA